MSFTPINLAPGAMVAAGLLAWACGYPVAGWVLIGIPFALGLLALAWYVLMSWLDSRGPPP